MIWLTANHVLVIPVKLIAEFVSHRPPSFARIQIAQIDAQGEAHRLGLAVTVSFNHLISVSKKPVVSMEVNCKRSTIRRGVFSAINKPYACAGHDRSSLVVFPSVAISDISWRLTTNGKAEQPVCSHDSLDLSPKSPAIS